MDRKKRIKRQLQLKIVFGVFSICLLIGAGAYLTYAWYFSGDETSALEFQVLQIDSVVTVYDAIDINDNGVPDLLAANGQENGTYQYTEYDEEGAGTTSYVTYDLPYYVETHDFNYHDTTLVLEEDSVANTFQAITLEDVAPSKIYTIKYALANYNFATNVISFSFDKTSTSGSPVSVENELKWFRMRLGKVDQNGDITFGDWETFAFTADGSLAYTTDAYGNSSTASISPGSGVVTIDPYTGIIGSGRLDVWLQIQCLADTPNELQNKTIVFPDFRITFDAEYTLGE